MNHRKRALLSMLLVLLVMVVSAIPVAAATSATVTVTVVPSYVSISINSTSWAVNRLLGGTNSTATSTTYYSNPLWGGNTTAPSNPVTAAEAAYSLITNTSTVPIDLVANMGDFSSAGNPMENSNSGVSSPGAGTFGASIAVEGVNWSSATTMQATGSSAFKTSLAATTDIALVFGLAMQTGEWPDGDTQTSTITITATAS